MVDGLRIVVDDFILFGCKADYPKGDSEIIGKENLSKVIGCICGGHPPHPFFALLEKGLLGGSNLSMEA